MNTRNYSLVQAIDDQQLTQGAVARRADINETRFTKIARGYVSATPYEIKRISQVLGKSPAELGFRLNESASGNSAD